MIWTYTRLSTFAMSKQQFKNACEEKTALLMEKSGIIQINGKELSR